MAQIHGNATCSAMIPSEPRRMTTRLRSKAPAKIAGGGAGARIATCPSALSSLAAPPGLDGSIAVVEGSGGALAIAAITAAAAAAVASVFTPVGPRIGLYTVKLVLFVAHPAMEVLPRLFLGSDTFSNKYRAFANGVVFKLQVCLFSSSDEKSTLNICLDTRDEWRTTFSTVRGVWWNVGLPSISNDTY